MDFIDFTLFDAFRRSDEVYLILSINNNPVQYNDIIVKIGKRTPTFKCKYEKNNGEPILVFVYDSIDSDIDSDIEVNYRNLSFNRPLLNITNTANKTLALTTLFKDDYKLFTGFYEYYKSQGVEHFYMYYNGVLNDEIREVFNYKDVTLIEWNFRYWNPSNYRYMHHAQMGQIHDAMYKYGKKQYEYMIFNDLDEYFFIPNVKLIDFIKNNPQADVFGFLNVWSKTIDNSKVFKKDLYTAKPIEYKYRSKNIYKLNSIVLVNIHYPHKYSRENPICINDNVMFHFYNWSKPDRNEKVDILKELDIDFLLIP